MPKRGTVISSLAVLAAWWAAAPGAAEALPLARPDASAALDLAAYGGRDACCDPRGPARHRCRREARALGFPFDPRRACGERRARAFPSGRSSPSAAAPAPRFAAPAEEGRILRARPMPLREERRIERMRAEERFGRAPEEGGRARARRVIPEEAPRFGGEAAGGRAPEGSRARGFAPAPFPRAEQPAAAFQGQPARFAAPAAGMPEEGARPRFRREAPGEAPAGFGRAAPAAEMPHAAPAEQPARFMAPAMAPRAPEPAAHMGFSTMAPQAAPSRPMAAPAAAPMMNPAAMPHMPAPAPMPAAAPPPAMMAPPAPPHMAAPPPMPAPPPASPPPAPAAGHPPVPPGWLH